MQIAVSWDEEFGTLMGTLKEKYGEALFTLDGIGEQLDVHAFSKRFFAEDTVAADVSVDSNANVAARTGVEYGFEMSKPMKRLNSYFLLWKELRSEYGSEYAANIIENQLTGKIYINDFTDVSIFYCNNFSTYDIALLGIRGISKRLHILPPKSLETFLRQVEQFAVYAANSSLGATGLADVLIVTSLFVDAITKTGKDGHIVVHDVDTYVKERLISFIYTLNWEFRASQSCFTNVSVYDDVFLDSLCQDYILNGNTARKETVKHVQGLFLDAMNEEMARTPLTFPVTTACFCTDEKQEIQDKAFLRFIAEKNLPYGFINMYNGESTTLSSCCRLRSSTVSEYFNSFGAGATKIGSIGVVTANLPRLAMTSGPEKFMEALRAAFVAAVRVNACKRRLIQKRINLGAAPLYTYGYMSLSKQYSTFGLTGLYEALHVLGHDMLSEEGQSHVLDIMKTINNWIAEAETAHHAPHNVEQVPAESSAVKLCQKDRFLGFDCGVALYSNQFIPLNAPVDMLDRLRVQGLFDKAFSGGAICHVNVGERLDDTETLVRLMEYAARKGVVYWAVNYLLHVCSDRHTWVGTEHCPVCGKLWEDEITRVVGFFTHVKNWSQVRREIEWPGRQFYSAENLRVTL